MSDPSTPDQKDPQLSSLLREWQVHGEMDPGWEGRVWKRIHVDSREGEKTGIRGPRGLWAAGLGWLRAVLGSRVKVGGGGVEEGGWGGGWPRASHVAYASLPFLPLAAGLLAGALWGARQARTEAPLEYVASLRSGLNQAMAGTRPNFESSRSFFGGKVEKYGETSPADSVPSTRNP